jgi:hypothetical protein
MPKWISAGLMSFLFFVLVLPAERQADKASSKPDFSGTWLLDTKKSNTSGPTSRPDLPITISHKDPEFRVMLSTTSTGASDKPELVYFTDGRGETNQATSVLSTNPSATKPEDLKNQVTESKTKWSDDKIVTRSRLRLNVAGRLVEFEQVDEWKLSKDGKVLTQTNRVNFQGGDTAFIPAAAPDRKRVFNRL